MVRVEDLSFSYSVNGRKFPILKNINLHLKEGGVLSVIGPSGCGKTTLLFTIAGLRKPDTGTVYVNGIPVTAPRERTAVIFQHFGLLPWKNVFDNIALGLRIRGLAAAEIRKSVESVMDPFGIADLVGKYPKHLSGGEKQRVAIARALVLRPDLLLLDEPFSSIDALTRESLQEFLLRLWAKWHFTIIHVTHDIEEAVFLGTECVLLGRDGSMRHSCALPAEKGKDFRKRPVFHRTTAALRDAMGRIIDETPL